MSIMTVTTRINRQYLERKTKSDLAQMYLDLLDDKCHIEALLHRAWNDYGHRGDISTDTLIEIEKVVRHP